MELIVVVGAAMVVYCGYLAAVDEMRTWKRVKAVKEDRKSRTAHSNRRRIRIAISYPANDVAARWQEPLRDSF